MLGPAEAHRFARGETVGWSTGVRARLIRPLDLLMVADHAEALGVAPMIERSDPALLEAELGRLSLSGPWFCERNSHQSPSTARQTPRTVRCLSDERR